jgi:hypothetical protein
VIAGALIALAALGFFSFLSAISGVLTGAFRDGYRLWADLRRAVRQDRWDWHVHDALALANLDRDGDQSATA